MKTLLALLALALAGCTTPAAPTAADPAVYRPTHRASYPLPR